MKTVTLEIEGMHCDGCARTVKALVGTEPGVHGAEISHRDGRARIQYDPESVGEDRLVAVIETAGYKVRARSAWTSSAS